MFPGLGRKKVATGNMRSQEIHMESYGTEEEGIHAIARQNGFRRQEQSTCSCMTHKNKNRISQLNSHSVWDCRIMCVCLQVTLMPSAVSSCPGICCLRFCQPWLNLPCFMAGQYFLSFPVFSHSAPNTLISSSFEMIRKKMLVLLLTFPEGS